MKKKKNAIAIFALLALLIPAAAFIFAYSIAAGEIYHCDSMCERIALTNDGYAYIAYNVNGRPEIIKIDSGGSVLDINSGNSLPWDFGMEVAYISGVYSCEETVFAVEVHVDGTSGRTLRQVINKLDGETLTLSPFFTYEGDGAPRISHLTGSGGRLFATLLDGDGQKTFVDVFELTDGAPSAPSESLEFASPFNDRFFSALYVNGSIYASTMSGEVLRCSGGGTVNILDSPAREYDASGIIEALGADENGVFFYDAMDGFPYHADASGKLAKWDVAVAEYGEHTFTLAGAGAYRLALISKENASMMRIAFDGGITAELTELRLSPELIVKKSAPNAVLYSVAFVCVLLLVFLIVKAFQRRQRLLTKFLLVVAPLTLLAFTGFGFSQYIRLQDMLLSDKDLLSRHYNSLVANSISHGELDFINDPQAYKSPEYRRLQEKLRVGFGEDENGVSVQNDIFILRKGFLLTGVSSNYPCLYPAGDLFSKEMIGLINDCAELGRAATGTTWDWGDKWSTTVSAIKNDGGQTEGYVLTSVSKNDITALLNANAESFARLAIAIILPLLAILALILRRALAPVSRLRNAMQEVLAGNYEVRLDSVTKDEFMGINLVFNKMCADLKTQMYKLERISGSYYRFVPRNVLPVLGKKSILDVDYGDSKRFSACCCALCVHNLSELQSAGEDEEFLGYISMLSSFINASLERCDGFLMSSELDLRELRSVFPSRAEDCEAFAVCVRQFCASESSRFNGITPKITMILHKTDMLYGITGINDAAFPFLLSEGFDFIMRVAPLFENSRTQTAMTVITVITQDILSELADTPAMEIGWRETPGGGECKLYIPLDGEPARENFAKGLDSFYNRDFYNARALFSEVWRDKPSGGIGGIAQWYALAADKYLTYPGQFGSSQLFGTDVYRIDF